MLYDTWIFKDLIALVIRLHDDFVKCRHSIITLYSLIYLKLYGFTNRDSNYLLRDLHCNVLPTMLRLECT